MLKPPRLGGAGQLRLFVDDLGFDHACRVVDVHPSTMRRWLRGATEPPLAVLHALYWLTSWGFSDAFAEAHWTHQLLLGQLRALDTRIPARLVGLEAANEPIYHAPGLVVPIAPALA